MIIGLSYFTARLRPRRRAHARRALGATAFSAAERERLRQLLPRHGRLMPGMAPWRSLRRLRDSRQLLMMRRLFRLGQSPLIFQAFHAADWVLTLHFVARRAPVGCKHFRALYSATSASAAADTRALDTTMPHFALMKYGFEICRSTLDYYAADGCRCRWPRNASMRVVDAATRWSRRGAGVSAKTPILLAAAR